ncbi:MULTISPECIES: DUF3231 family protein [Priestia]|uniref:DUF3231 family protein n=1 Tax=Priestia TaxID=2800373 RepID=UPI0027E220F2|nr:MULTISPECIES: DUF3231 family protein [Priestia]MDY0942350.1 DUF3231 family protein [Priestia megaterium]
MNLTSSEIASLWTAYMNDIMAKCILSYMLKHIQDSEVQPVIQLGLIIASNHLEQLSGIFEYENFAIPNGFTESDVNLNAPSLFTDAFYLTYLNHMSKFGLLAYSGFIVLSAREDMRNYFIQCLTETSTLFNQSSEVLINKGLFVRSPYIMVPSKIDYIDTKK